MSWIVAIEWNDSNGCYIASDNSTVVYGIGDSVLDALRDYTRCAHEYLSITNTPKWCKLPKTHFDIRNRVGWAANAVPYVVRIFIVRAISGLRDLLWSVMGAPIDTPDSVIKIG